MQPEEKQVLDPEQPQIMEDQGNKEIIPADAAMEAEVKEEEDDKKKLLDDIRIDESLFTIPPEMQQQSNNLVYRQRRTRWGERQIKRAKIQEDAVFNPLEALYSGNSLLPITQYGQAEIQIKLSLYSQGKRRKSKWHHEIEKTFTPPMISYISPNIGLDEVQYLIRLYRLDELTAKINDFQPDDPDIRSPSPQPIYDKDGRRINTREIRKRDALHRERISLIEDCMKMRSTFVPPDDYKPLKKYKKIYLTETAINDTKNNYIGKIIGPEGKTQKFIEKRSNCKIGVRGRGANKHQKDIFENYEPLHIIVVADNDDDLDKGVNEVHKILNGDEDQEYLEMLKDFDKQIVTILDDNYCENCKQEGHRTWACPFEMKNKANVLCSICGETTHPTSDCPERQAYLKRQQTNQINMLLESQYSQFKSDLNQDSNKNKGGLAFITDERKDLQAITADKSRGARVAEKKQMQPQKKNAKPAPMFGTIPEEIPKFEDD